MAALEKPVRAVNIVVVGSCMRDLTSFTPRLPKPGETIRGHNFIMSFGGKGANQCVAATKMGARTALVASLGDDDHGQSYYKELERMHINVDYVTFTPKAHTGIASIMVDDHGQNSIVIMSGANDLINKDNVGNAGNLIARSSVLVCQWEIPMDVNLAALRLARKHGVTTVFNAAPANKDIPAEVFNLSDVFCVNETEAEIILERHVTSVDEARVAVELLLERGCGTAMVTMGEKGVVLASKGQAECTIVAPRPVDTVDTTGAGDAFIGALAFYLSTRRELPMSEIVRRACHVASFSVQHPGTQESFPSRASLPVYLFL